MNFLNGIKNFLQFINDNWTVIVVIIALVIAIVRKIMIYVNKTDEERIEIVKEQIKETILKLVTDAEVDYQEWVKAGAVKRSQVIEKIFLTYPVLTKVADQKGLVVWLDKIIDEALKTMREIFAENKEQDMTVIENKEQNTVADFEIEVELETDFKEVEANMQ